MGDGGRNGRGAEISSAECRDHPRGCPGGIQVDRSEPRMGVLAADERDVQLPRQFQVLYERGLAAQ
jgi:hypothetical protein